MKKTGIYGLLSVAVLMMAGCQTDLVDGNRGEVPIVLTATVLDSHGPTVTRAGIDLQSTQLPNGTTFEATFTGSGVTVSNATYTADGLGGATTTPQPYFTFSGTSTTVHAFYPSKPSGDTFSVQTDQSSDDAYKASDLMYASAAIPKVGLVATGALTFTHKMSKIIVNATVGTGISSINAVRIVGGQPTVALSGSNCTLGDVSGTPFSDSPLTIFSGTHSEGTLSCAALIPPQTIGATAETAFLQVVTDKGNITYSVSNKALATGLSYTYNITVTAAIIGVTIDITDWDDQGITNLNNSDSSILNLCPPAGVEAVDLGLPSGTLWANRNIGANSETDYGQYFAWGDVVGHSATDGYDFSWANYKWTTDGGSTFTKYTGSDYNWLLLSADDAATANWGSNWRMPTQAECQELLDNTTKAWTSDYNSTGVAGYTFTGNGQTLFLPAAGYRLYTSVYDQGSYGSYWSSTLLSDYPDRACRLSSYSSDAFVGSRDRYSGFPVRPVYDEHPLSSATASDVGKVICSKGHIHSTVSAVRCGGVASGIIAYVGSAGSVETGQSYKGLALALVDCNKDNCSYWSGSNEYEPWCSQSSSYCTSDYTTAIATAVTKKNGLSMTTTLVGHASHTHHAAKSASGYNASRPSGASAWFLPSMGQWNLICQGLATKKAGSSVTTNLTTSSISTYQASNLNSVITGAGGTGFQYFSYYWSSSEYTASGAWSVDFVNGYAGEGSKEYTYCYVRAVFAF